MNKDDRILLALAIGSIAYLMMKYPYSTGRILQLIFKQEDVNES